MSSLSSISHQVPPGGNQPAGAIVVPEEVNAPPLPQTLTPKASTNKFLAYQVSLKQADKSRAKTRDKPGRCASCQFDQNTVQKLSPGQSSRLRRMSFEEPNPAMSAPGEANRIDAEVAQVIPQPENPQSSPLVDLRYLLQVMNYQAHQVPVDHYSEESAFQEQFGQVDSHAQLESMATFRNAALTYRQNAVDEQFDSTMARLQTNLLQEPPFVQKELRNSLEKLQAVRSKLAKLSRVYASTAYNIQEKHQLYVNWFAGQSSKMVALLPKLQELDAALQSLGIQSHLGAQAKATLQGYLNIIEPFANRHAEGADKRAIIDGCKALRRYLAQSGNVDRPMDKVVKAQDRLIAQLGVRREQADATMSHIAHNHQLWQIVNQREQVRLQQANLRQQCAKLESKVSRWQAVQDVVNDIIEFPIPVQTETEAFKQLMAASLLRLRVRTDIDRLTREVRLLDPKAEQSAAAVQEFLDSPDQPQADKAYLRYTNELGEKMVALQTSPKANIATFDDEDPSNRPAAMIRDILEADKRLADEQEQPLQDAYAAARRSQRGARRRRPYIEEAELEYSITLSLGKSSPRPFLAPPPPNMVFASSEGILHGPPSQEIAAPKPEVHARSLMSAPKIGQPTSIVEPPPALAPAAPVSWQEAVDAIRRQAEQIETDYNGLSPYGREAYDRAVAGIIAGNLPQDIDADTPENVKPIVNDERDLRERIEALRGRYTDNHMASDWFNQLCNSISQVHADKMSTMSMLASDDQDLLAHLERAGIHSEELESLKAMGQSLEDEHPEWFALAQPGLADVAPQPVPAMEELYKSMDSRFEEVKKEAKRVSEAPADEHRIQFKPGQPPGDVDLDRAAREEADLALAMKRSLEEGQPVGDSAFVNKYRMQSNPEITKAKEAPIVEPPPGLGPAAQVYWQVAPTVEEIEGLARRIENAYEKLSEQDRGGYEMAAVLIKAESPLVYSLAEPSEDVKTIVHAERQFVTRINDLRAAYPNDPVARSYVGKLCNSIEGVHRCNIFLRRSKNARPLDSVQQEKIFSQELARLKAVDQSFQ